MYYILWGINGKYISKRYNIRFNFLILPRNPLSGICHYDMNDILYFCFYMFNNKSFIISSLYWKDCSIEMHICINAVFHNTTSHETDINDHIEREYSTSAEQNITKT
jgi:hypothetical protein